MTKCCFLSYAITIFPQEAQPDASLRLTLASAEIGLYLFIDCLSDLLDGVPPAAHPPFIRAGRNIAYLAARQFDMPDPLGRPESRNPNHLSLLFANMLY